MKFTLKAGTGRRIFEFESLAIYWYKGILLCAALHCTFSIDRGRISIGINLPSFAYSYWNAKDSIGTIFFYQ
jgi:hypothetical protein